MAGEYLQQIDTKSHLKELLRNDFQKGSLPFEPLSQVAPNVHVQVYKVHAMEGDLFTKVYRDTPDIAQKEYENYQQFRDLGFIPALRYHIFPTDSEKRLLAYDFIEGDDLHEQFTRNKATGVPSDEDIVYQCIEQTQAMGEVLAGKETQFAKSPWPLRSPVRQGLLTEEGESHFTSDYAPAFQRNEETLRLFPGYYFDRNPRNLMHQNGQVYQIDFGVSEWSSPIFDLIKLLRNGTDIPLPDGASVHDAISNSEIVHSLSVYDSAQEQKFKDHLYSKLESQTATSGTRDDFERAYDYAALHNHLFYTTKYIKMLRDGRGEADELQTRSFYHVGSGYETIEKLASQGEPVEQLKKWMNLFIKAAS
jgi:hypothetical protein